jgi:hypothetical protein
MGPVVKEVRSGSDTDPDWNAAEAIRRAIRWNNLDEEEVRYLCKRFGVLTEEVKW